MSDPQDGDPEADGEPDADGGPGVVNDGPGPHVGTGGTSYGWLAPELQALAAGVAAVAASFAVAGTSSSFVAVPVSAVVVALTPDVVVTQSILLLGDAGSYLALAAGLGTTVLLFALAARPGVKLAAKTPTAGVPLTGAVVGLLAVILTAAPLSALAVGLAGAAVTWAPHRLTGPRANPEERRSVLAAVGTALGVGVLGTAIRADSLVGGGAGPNTESTGSTDPEVRSLLSTAGERSLDVDGLEPLVSESFYTVDIAQFDPKVDTEGWSLSVTGNVDEDLSYEFANVRERDARHRFVSLRCVGDDLNGPKLDTALWTGVPIWDLVEPAGPAEDCCVRLRAEDGYYQVFPLDALKRGFLAYGMNGGPLPRGHGAPARVLIPGHWGEINVKWLTEIEILDEEVDGYWEERGWHGTGPVNTVAKLWVTNHLDDGRVEVAGHAYAGTRGVQRVEVSTDGGDTWTDATLSDPPPLADDEPPGTPGPGTDDLAAPGRDVWRQWVHRYDPPDGAHEVVVRAVDGTGAVQPEDESGAFPSGATGWVSKTVRP